MRAGNVAKGVNHGQHDQAEGQRNPHMGNASPTDLVNDDRASPRENEREGPETFRNEFFCHPDLRGLQADLVAPLLNLRPDFVTNDPDLFEFCGFTALHF